MTELEMNELRVDLWFEKLPDETRQDVHNEIAKMIIEKYKLPELTEEQIASQDA